MCSPRIEMRLRSHPKSRSLPAVAEAIAFCPRIEMRLVRIRSPGGAIVFSPARSKPAAGRRRRSAGKVNLPPILFLLLKVP